MYRYLTLITLIVRKFTVFICEKSTNFVLLCLNVRRFFYFLSLLTDNRKVDTSNLARFGYCFYFKSKPIFLPTTDIERRN